MLDIKLFREKSELIKESQKKRGESLEIVDEILETDKLWREAIQKVEKLKHERNTVNIKIAEAKKKGAKSDEEIKEMRTISETISKLDTEIKELEAKRDKLRLNVPNILAEDVPIGTGPEHNKIIKTVGKPKKFKFTPKSHTEIGELLNMVDTERASKSAGARFYYLKGQLARLNYAIISFALDFLTKKGLTPITPPYMINRAAIEGAVPMDAFEEMIYKIDGEDLYLIGTSEHAVAEYLMNETIDAKELPIKFAGVSPCFRKEAGAHGKDTKGIFRVHQFEKIEQFVFCKPEKSWKEFDFLQKNAEELFKKLELPFRVVVLCSKETGRVPAKTYDLEVWFPSQKEYRELGSCSNVLSYQAIRSNIRYREGSETKFPHMLNNTGIAVQRTLCAIMENHQQKDGSVKIPKALWKYTGFKKMVPLK